MKYIKKYESFENTQIKEYIIAKSKLNDEYDYFLIHVIGADEDFITYDKYAIIDKMKLTDNIKEQIEEHYEDWSKSDNKVELDNLIIFFQADKEEECYDTIKTILSAKKYNL